MDKSTESWYIMTVLETYNIIVDGMTQEDREFRDAIMELDARADFYTLKRSALNKLNHAMIGLDINREREIEIVGMVDFEKNHMVIQELTGEKVYNLDGIDPRYLSYINNLEYVAGRENTRLPLSRVALELLDEQTPEIEAKPDLTKLESKPSEISGTTKLLRQSFNNEMLLLVQLDNFIKDNGLETIVDSHKDDLIKLVGTHAYDYDFKNSVEKLEHETLDIIISK